MPELINRDVDRATQAVRQRFLDDRTLVERLQKPDLDSLLAFVRFASECIERLNKAARLEPEWASLVWVNALQSSLPVVVCHRHKRNEWAFEQLFAVWRTSLCVWGQEVPPIAPRERHRERRHRDWTHLAHDFEYVVTFNLAVAEVIKERFGGARARTILEKVRTLLSMSFDDVGRMLKVSGETVRRWERGASAVPPAHMATLASMGSALDRMVQLIKPERLPQAISRKADLFGGRTARELILEGAIEQVANQYELALRFQG